MNRTDRRSDFQLRDISFQKGISHPSQLSIQVNWGNTIVLCGISLENSVPRFLKGSKKGWLTSEYSMLPLSSHERITRERNRTNNRAVEIQRLIGRCLRSMVDLSVLGERTLMIDCDVLSADGGTRTASITGASLGLQVLLRKAVKENRIPSQVLRFGIAAVSLGIVNGKILLDLDYNEDSQADADFNLIMSDQGKVIEVQGCAEKAPFSHAELHRLLEIGHQGIQSILEKQTDFLSEVSL